MKKIVISMKNAGPIMKNENRFRYPGVAPFSSAQEEIFFGRETEIERLTSLVTNEQQVLLYAKSGLGKSSLINAGLIPRLAKEPHTILLNIRLGAYQGPQSPAPLDVIHAALPPVQDTFLDQLIIQESSLWQHFKSITLTAPQPLRFYIIFDQFEELFSHPKEAVFAFKKQLADLLYRVVPKHFRAVLEIKQRTQPELLSEDELRLLNSKMDVHVLYAIREDRYSYMNRLADYLPDLMHTRFQLAPLTRAKAEAAITRPAGIDDGFATPAFHYTTWALNSILDYLTHGQKQAIETTQLQILCSLMEKLRKPEIRKEDIPKFDDIFLQFYYDCINALPWSERKPAQSFVEDRLIIAGQRVALDRLACQEYLDDKALDTLLRDRHLLRSEQNSTGGTSLEISHDTLVAPILRARTLRVTREAEAARVAEEERLLRELEREQALRQKERRRLQLTKRALVGAVIAVVFAFTGFVIAYKMWAKANRNATAARKERATAVRAMEVANNLRDVADQQIAKYEAAVIKEQKGKAGSFVLTNEFELAIIALDSALRVDSCDFEARNWLDSLVLKHPRSSPKKGSQTP